MVKIQKRKKLYAYFGASLKTNQLQRAAGAAIEFRSAYITRSLNYFLVNLNTLTVWGASLIVKTLPFSSLTSV
jgi:hypothetical protein